MPIARIANVRLALKSKASFEDMKRLLGMEMLRLQNAYRVPHAVDMLTIVIYDLWKFRPLIQLSSRWTSAPSVHCSEMICFKLSI